MKPTSADKTVKLWERSDKKLEKMFQRFVSDISQNNYDPTQITERITFHSYSFPIPPQNVNETIPCCITIPERGKDIDVKVETQIAINETRQAFFKYYI